MRPAIRSATRLLTLAILLLASVLVGAGAATAAATPTPSPSGSGTPGPCPDPGPAPSGLSATGVVQLNGTVQATITWTPLNVPSHCSGTVEIEQVTPPGAATTAPFDAGRKVISGLKTQTSYTWRVRYNAGTVSEWGTVTMPQVLPEVFCLPTSVPHPITGTALSPTSVHLAWGHLDYYDVCAQRVRITSNAGTPPVTVSITETGVDITGLTPGATYTWTVAVLNTLGSVTVTQPPSTEPTCTATLHEDPWATGLVGTVTVRNSSTRPLTRWAVQVRLQPGLRVEQIWGADGSPGTGVLNVTNLSWNATVPAGGSTTFGYLASFSSPSTTVPTLSCTAG